MNQEYNTSSNLNNLERWINENRKICVSLAPSFLAEFQQPPEKVAGALKQLGITHVEETVVVLPKIVKKRIELINNKDKTIIFSSCPKVRKLIEDNFPEYTKFLCGLPSPMLIHGKILRERFPEAKLVFIGPCYAKQKEEMWFYDRPVYDLVLTFKELKTLLNRKGIKTCCTTSSKMLSEPEPWARAGLLIYHKSGMDEVITYLKKLRKIKSREPAVELLACSGGCLMGPGMSINSSLEERVEAVKKLCFREGKNE